MTALRADLATVAAGFGSLLRAGGVPVTPERSARFAAAVLVAEPRDTAALYWLARVTLLDGPEQIDLFDRAFAQVFGGLSDVADHRGDPADQQPRRTTDVRPSGEREPPEGDQPPGEAPAPARDGVAGGGEGDEQADSVLATASTDERLRGTDFAMCTPEELAQVRRLVEQLRWTAPRRRARRTRSSSRGRRLDVRRMLRTAHRTGGDPARRRYRRRTNRPRRLVLIADVSGSMESYARVYLHLLHGAVRGARAEAFVFATRLTRLTRPLAGHHPDVALAQAAAAAPDWSGGTRIGGALATFLDDHGRRGLARGAVVVIVSDGWERDDPAVLGEQMARLGRLAHRVVWVNPRKAAEGFVPLAGGMAAALPHVDGFCSGHSLGALDEVLAALHD